MQPARVNISSEGGVITDCEWVGEKHWPITITNELIATVPDLFDKLPPLEYTKDSEEIHNAKVFIRTDI